MLGKIKNNFLHCANMFINRFTAKKTDKGLVARNIQTSKFAQCKNLLSYITVNYFEKSQTKNEQIFALQKFAHYWVLSNITDN